MPGKFRLLAAAAARLRVRDSSCLTQAELAPDVAPWPCGGVGATARGAGLPAHMSSESAYRAPGLMARPVLRREQRQGCHTSESGPGELSVESSGLQALSP